MKKLKITERGWAGHFCASQSCGFRRNTLIECGKKRVVVSTIGNYKPYSRLGSLKDSKREAEIGINRFYETMAFEAKFDSGYWEADVSKQIDFKSKWSIDTLEHKTDLEANDMHEDVVKELCKVYEK